MPRLRIPAGSRPRDPGLLVVLAATALLAGAYGLWAWQRHRWYLTSGYDLGIFDQATRNLAGLRAPASSLREVQNLWGDHLHPIIVLWGGLRAVWPSPVALLVSQAALVALAMVPLYLLARDRAGRAAGVLIALAYGTSWGVQRAIDFDVHELAFAPVLLAGAVLAADRRRWPLFWVAVALLLCVKEDVSLVVAALGLWLVLEGERRRGAVAVVLGVAWFVLATRWWIPALGDQPFTYWSYSRFGDGPLSALVGVLTHPWRLVTVGIEPSVKLETLVALLVPFAVVTPWLTRLAILPVPLLAERFLSDQPQYWSTSFHYSLLPTMALAIASAGGIATIRRALERRAARRSGRAADGRAADGRAADDPAAEDLALDDPWGSSPAAAPDRTGRGAALVRRAPVAIAAVGLLAGTIAWFPVYGAQGDAFRPPLAELARLEPPPRIIDRHVQDRIVAATPGTGSIAAPRTLQPHLTGRDQDVFLLESRIPGDPPHVATADNVLLDLTDPTTDAVSREELLGPVLDALDERLAAGDVVPVRSGPEGWVVLRSPAAPGGATRDPGLGVVAGRAGDGARGAAAAWARALDRTAPDCAGTCTTGARATLDAAARAQTAAVRRAAAASDGTCRPILSAVSASAERLLALRAATEEDPGDGAAALAWRQAVDGRLARAARRALLVCAPGDGPAPGRGLPAGPAAPG